MSGAASASRFLRGMIGAMSMCRTGHGGSVGFVVVALLFGLVPTCWGEEGSDNVKTVGENENREKFDEDKYFNPPYLVSLGDFRFVLENAKNAKIGEYQISSRLNSDNRFGEETIHFSLKRDEKVYHVWLSDYRSWNINLKSIVRRPVQRPEKIPTFMKVKRTDAFYSVIHTSRSEIQYFDLRNRYWIWVMPSETYDGALERVDQIVQALVSLIEARVPEAKGLDAKKPE